MSKENIEFQKIEMFKELGIADNPKREMLWDVAYDLGHSVGIDKIFLYMEDLVELIR